MSFFDITNEEQGRLQRLNADKAVMFALKKLFLNVCTTEPASNEAIKKITRAFQELSAIQLNKQEKISEDNTI